MSKWAVSYIDWNDYCLITEIHEADNWHEAVFKHSKVAPIIKEDVEWYVDLLKLDQENVKQAFFDMDSMVEAILIP